MKSNEQILAVEGEFSSKTSIKTRVIMV